MNSMEIGKRILLGRRKIVSYEKGEDIRMSEKRLNNCIFLMYLISNNYMKTHGLTVKEFVELDRKYAILNYIVECPDIFDSMSDSEMVEEIERYVCEI